MDTRKLTLGVFALLLCLSLGGLHVHADQVIYVEVSNFSPALSQFGVEVKGNTWEEVEEDGALLDTAFGVPGDNNFNADGGEPLLVIKLPETVKQGESTDDGKVWAAWGRFYMPAMVIEEDGPNSMYLRMSPDAQKWLPPSPGDDTLHWNNPGGTKKMFPVNINGVDTLLTDVGDVLPWMWSMAWDASESGNVPVLAVGDNYCDLGPRESDPVNFPRIDVLCFRNDGGLPSDAEALEYLGASQPVQPEAKLANTWGRMKSD